jgi:phosphoserine phosphatase
MAESVLTLVAAPAASPALRRAIDIAADALAQHGARVTKPNWLGEQIACDIALDGPSPGEAEGACRAAIFQALGPVAIDLIAQACEGRKKSLLVADMEATIIANEMLDELAELRGLRAQISTITARAMNGEVDFAAALKERVALLKGLPESALAHAASRIRITTGAKSLVATMRAHGAYAALVSGGFSVFANQIRDEIGFDRAFANELVIEDGRLSGTVREPILAREAKLSALKSLAADRGVPLAGTLAVGDGANDLPMLEAAGLGIAYHAKPAVAAQARFRIDHTDLTSLLYAQGYRQQEIVAR